MMRLTDCSKGGSMGAHITKEDATMSNAERTKRHHAKLDEFKIRPYIEEGQEIRAFAERAGLSVNGLFMEAVREYMNNHKEEK